MFVFVLKREGIAKVSKVWRVGIVVHCRWECKMVQPMWKTVRQLLKKKRIVL